MSYHKTCSSRCIMTSDCWTQVSNDVTSKNALLHPYVTIAILVAGAGGGFILVVSIILLCKYCIRKEKEFKRSLSGFYILFPLISLRWPFNSRPSL